MTIFDLNTRAKSIKTELLVHNAVMDRQKDIIQYFQEYQLQRGLTSNTDYTEQKRVYRDEEYSAFKKDIVNPRADGFVDLKYSGDFYKGMYLEKTLDGGFMVDSTDWKTKHLIKKYGESILFIGDRVALRYIIPNIITPEIKKRVENILFA